VTSFASELATPSVTDVRYVRTYTDTLITAFNIYKDYNSPGWDFVAPAVLSLDALLGQNPFIPPRYAPAQLRWRAGAQ